MSVILNNRLTTSITNSSFGLSCAISGNFLVIGAYSENSYTGAAYIYTYSNGSWSTSPTRISSNVANSVFGGSVAISGNTIVIGAQQENNYAGAAYIFVRSETTWAQKVILTANNKAENDYFGLNLQAMNVLKHVIKLQII